MTTENFKGLPHTLAVALSATIQALGPLPNEAGDGVRAIMRGIDDVAMCALGCYLQDSVVEGSYAPLVRGLEDIASGQRAAAKARSMTEIPT